MLCRNLCLVAGFLLIIGSSALADGGETSAATTPVTLKLDRPAHVGDTNEYSSHALSSQETTASQGGKEVQHELKVREVSCTVLEHVLKVSEYGQVLQRRAELKTFQARNADGVSLQPIDLAGVTVETTMAPDTEDVTVTRTDGKSLSDDDKAYLALIFSGSHRNEKENDDTIFGPSRPVKVGDTWKANHALISSGLSHSSGMTLPVTSLTSEFTLASQQTIGSTNYLTVNGTVHANPITMAVPNTVGGKPFSGTMQLTLAKTLPADPTKKERDSSLDLQISLKGTLSDPSGPVDMKMVMKQHLDTKTLSAEK